MAKGEGGKKIKMVKMENKNHLQVTFSKRRSGLFNKGNQICTLCGAKVLLIVFSPTNKVYSFGHPSAEILIDRFLSGEQTEPQQDPTMQYVEAQRNEDVRYQNIKYAQLMGQIEEEKKRSAQLKEMKDQGLWWGEIDELDWKQLLYLKASLQELKRKVAAEARRILAEGPSPHPATPFVTFGGQSSSNGAINPLGLNGRFNWPMMPQLYNHFGYGVRGFE